ncbi:hypothetical protein LJ739_07035 [Aestuariibacter halophilus]|uniref:VOC domain-containing protein n=1 Tax=Fluctibacter halophilus TaxID=226011 RepID=A0ABS8G9U6_9ALTE|nr:hypothetical protein [Aestuariibacter halophilus]MCC2615991.1 hypothetical protein [Aestuariibacter halophilus]
MNEHQQGKMAWMDLTVDDADGVSAFYTQVLGWQVENVGMGDYNDYAMKLPGSDSPVAGVCHARGTNQDVVTVFRGG